MKTTDFSYFIERFNAGEMSDSEKIWFLKEMEGNPALRNEVDLRKQADNVINKTDIISLREKLINIESRRNTGKTARSPWKGILKYAAIVAGIAFLAGGLLLIPRPKLTGEGILEKYYAPYEAPSPSRSGSIISNADYNLAVDYYKVKDYRNAAVYFSKVLREEPKNMNSWLMNGISNFEISNYPEAESSFETVINDNNNLYIDHAQWYLALCYIKTGEAIKAKDQLRAIKDSGSIHGKEAGKILKQLK
jgi:tetratricopeptide (TPR) repeat protein